MGHPLAMRIHLNHHPGVSWMGNERIAVSGEVVWRDRLSIYLSWKWWDQECLRSTLGLGSLGWDSGSFDSVRGREVLVFASCSIPPQSVGSGGLTNKQRTETPSTTAERQEAGRLKEHRLHLGNKTVIQQWHIEGTTHAYDIFSPKQLKLGSGGSNRLKGKGVGDRQLIEDWFLSLFLGSEAGGQRQKSEALGPLLTSYRHFNCEFCLFVLDDVVEFLSLEDVGQKLLCCSCLFCSGILFYFPFFKK